MICVKCGKEVTNHFDGECIDCFTPLKLSEMKLFSFRDAVDEWGCIHDHPDILKQVDAILMEHWSKNE